MTEIFKLFGTVAINGVDEAEREINGLSSTAESSGNKLISTFKKIGGAVATYFAVDKIVSFGQEIVNTAATVAAEESAFAQIMGSYADEASEKMGKVADSVGMVDTRLTPYMTSLTAKFKGLGYGVEDATSYASRGLTLAADASAFWDKSLDESMSHLNSFINGSYEGGEAIGLFANDTQMAAYAVKQGIVSETKEWAKLDEATKQATRLEYAENMLKQAGAVGQAAKESGQYANSSGNLAEKWRQLKAELGEPILQNIVIPAMQKLYDFVSLAGEKVVEFKQYVSENKEEFIDFGNKVKEKALEVGEIVVYLAGLFGAFKVAMGIQSAVKGWQEAQLALKLFTMEANGASLAQGALNGALTIGQTIVGLLTGKITLAQLASGLLTKAQAALNAVLSANPIAIIITLIAALVVAFIYLWNNCEGFRQFWIDLWEKIKTAFSAFVEWISPAIEQIKAFFISLWEKVKEVWNGIVESLKPAIEEVKAAFQMAWETIKVIWDYVQPYFSGIWEGIKAVFSVVKTILVMHFKNAWEGIKLVWAVAVDFFKTIWNNIKAVFQVVKTVLLGFFKTAWVAIKAVWNTAVSFFTLVWAGIKAVFAVVKAVLTGDFKGAWDAIKNVWSKAKAFFSTVWSGIKNIFGSVKSWFSSTFSAAWSAIKSVFSNWGSFFSGLWSKITNTFSKIGTNISNAIGSAVKSGINGVISVIEGTINTGVNLINGAIGLINLLPGVNVGKIGKLKLPRLAEGGIVTKSTIAQIGENGAEAVVPLERNTGWIDKVAAKFTEQSGGIGKVDDLIAILAEYFPMILAAMERDVVLDTGATVGALAAPMNQALGKLSSRKDRGR